MLYLFTYKNKYTLNFFLLSSFPILICPLRGNYFNPCGFFLSYEFLKNVFFHFTPYCKIYLCYYMSLHLFWQLYNVPLKIHMHISDFAIKNNNPKDFLYMSPIIHASQWNCWVMGVY